MSLSEKVASLIQDAEVERQTLETRRSELAAERAAKIAELEAEHRARVLEIRRDYRAQIEEVERSLALAARLRRALDPPKQAPKRKRDPSQVKGRGINPSEESKLAALRALSEGAQTVQEIAASEAFPWSEGYARYALEAMREDGRVRLKGEVLAPNGRNKRKAYRITPAGQQSLRTSSENGVPA